MTMPKVMRDSPREIEQFAPRAKRISEAAAQAAQHVIDLEADNARLNEQLIQMKAMLQMAEDKNKELTAQLTTAKLDADYHQQRSIEISTKLKMSAQIILDAMKEPGARETTRQHGLEAIAELPKTE